jgi:hypothetical protein
MNNKKTILIFAGERNAVFARAIKERLGGNKELLTVIIGEKEFQNTALQIAMDLVLKPDGIVVRTARRLFHERPDKNIDKLPKAELQYKDNSPVYMKMRNVFGRYRPEIVILLDGTLLAETLAVRARFSQETKVFVPVIEFFARADIVSGYVDRYFAENMAVLTMLANLGIKEKAIAISNIQVTTALDPVLSQEEAYAIIGAEPGKKLILFCCRDKSAEIDRRTLLELREFTASCGIVAACGEDRELLEFALSLGYKAFNEGADYNALYTAADLVVTRPNALTAAEALYKQKRIVLTDPANESEKRSLKGLKGLAIEAIGKGSLVTFLDDYLRTPGFAENFDGIGKEVAARLARPNADYLIEAIKTELGLADKK